MDTEDVSAGSDGNSQFEKVDEFALYIECKLYGGVGGIGETEEGLKVCTRTLLKHNAPVTV